MLNIASKDRYPKAIMKPRQRVTIVACILAGFLGGLVASLVRAPVHAADPIVYRAQRFELVGPNGQVGAVLDFSSSSDPRPRLTLGAHQEVILEAAFTGGELHLKNDFVGKSQIVLGNANIVDSPDQSKSGSWIQIDGRNGSTIWRAP